MHPLQMMIQQRKQDKPCSVVSVCSANRYVIEASLGKAKREHTPALIEATANQVNQFGGYTGMNPADFREYVYSIADHIGFDRRLILLGGDHLGPLTWKHLPSQQAMEHAKTLVCDYVDAGFTKIHLDTSMRLADDSKDAKIDVKTVAARGAELCLVAEERALHTRCKPVYIIGSEVPIPGGAEQSDDSIFVTTPEDLSETLSAYRNIFTQYGLSDAFLRVIAVVVQPGVEFSDEHVTDYNRSKAASLMDAKKAYPEICFEGHSTDYQLPEKILQLSEDGVGILKVGPALTFALREALFALEAMEQELVSSDQKSDFKKTLENEMIKDPSNWENHYRGDEHSQYIKRSYAYSDRCRYYLPKDEVNRSIERLLNNLSMQKIPLPLLSQYMPTQYWKVRRGQLDNQPRAWLLDAVDRYLDDYYGSMVILSNNSLQGEPI